MADLRLAQPLTLKSGLTLPNRLVKAAMAEKLADATSLPASDLQAAYAAWAAGGWGMVLTGNVQVDARFLNGPGDVTLSPSVSRERVLAAWCAWAQACKGGPEGKTKAVVQINHPGRQSPIGAGAKGLLQKNLAPSAVPLRLGEGLLPAVASRLVFGTPKEMSVEEIAELVRQFAGTAKLAAEAGFDGVEVHAAHGYLLAQFLSERVNRRTDAYGGDAKRRARVVVEIVQAIRKETPEGFCVGIKLNSVDHQAQGELDSAVEQLRLIAEAGVDFVEVSGGSYEDPKMLAQQKDTEEKKAASTKAREAFFIEFATAIRHQIPEVPLMVTGGFRSRRGMETAVADGDCDLVGLGRPAVMNPSLPNSIVFNKEIKDEDATLYAKKIQAPWLVKQLKIKGLGAGVETNWYSKQIGVMGTTQVKSKA